MNRYIKSFGFSQKKVAQHIGISYVSLSYKLNFYKGLQLTASEIISICDLIGCDYCEFLIEYVNHRNGI